jgi:hypothetical protein
MKIFPVGERTDGWTDSYDEAVCDFAKAPKRENIVTTV